MHSLQRCSSEAYISGDKWHEDLEKRFYEYRTTDNPKIRDYSIKKEYQPA